MKKIYYIAIALILVVSIFFLSNNLNSKSNEIVVEGTQVDDEANIEEIAEPEVFQTSTQLPVLMYHHFVEDGEKTSSTTVSRGAFEEQMAYLKSKGYNTVTDEDIVDFYYNGKELPENPIHITIDDGYKSNYDIAYPILKENGMKATIYVIGSRVESTMPGIPRFTWEQAREMLESGVISIQSHTYDLHHKEAVGKKEKSAMVAYDDSKYLKKITDDLILNKKLIEYELNNEVISLTYPYGSYDNNTLVALEKAGYKVAYTVKPGVSDIKTNPLELTRINVLPDWSGETLEKEIDKRK